jgi:predicted DNA-binding transcriptional regulator AlpA
MFNQHEPTGMIERPSDSKPLTEIEAAARLGLKVATLRAWRHQRRGPAFVRLGRAIRYLERDIDAFLNANRHSGLTPVA